jgi:hypothetical protein
MKKVPPRTALGQLFFCITPTLIGVGAGLTAALLCFLYITADYNLDLWQHFSMLKLIFEDDVCV